MKKNYLKFFSSLPYAQLYMPEVDIVGIVRRDINQNAQTKGGCIAGQKHAFHIVGRDPPVVAWMLHSGDGSIERLVVRLGHVGGEA